MGRFPLGEAAPCSQNLRHGLLAPGFRGQVRENGFNPLVAKEITGWISRLGQPVGKENEMRWVVFDGDVDALWVENMNSGTHTQTCQYRWYQLVP